MNLNKEEEKMVFEHMVSTNPDTCGKCFCNDLCLFLLMRTGVATTCSDFQSRVRKVINREFNKMK